MGLVDIKQNWGDNSMANEVLLSVENLKKHFNLGKGKTVKAVNGISFDIYKGETFGLVGESGCGKSTAGRTILGLYPCTDGKVLFEGKDVHAQSGKDRDHMLKNMQMIFQDPYASLNPRSTVFEIIAEPMEVHGLYKDKGKLRERVFKLLEDVGLDREHANRYPHEFSGGQRQRIGIARALALDSKLIIADEPISALDVSVQASIVKLLQTLQKEKGLTYLFIAHDLSMVKYISKRIGVMYLGQMVELTTSEQLYHEPLHPYTKALLSAIPIPDPDIEEQRQRIILKGELPSPIDPPSGCVFHTRCQVAQEVCKHIEPRWLEKEKGHFVSCHLYDDEVMTAEKEASTTIE